MSILLPSPSFPSRELIGGVIVTYHPDVAFENRFDLVKYQVAHMVVVDNSCTPGVGARLSRLAGACVDVIKNDHNLGVATGLNQGVRRVDELGLSWALLLDQDTVVDDDLVDCLAEIWRQHASPTEIGLIGANSRSTASGRLGIQSSPGASGYVELKTIVTSGSLLAMAAYERIGPFRDDFF